MHSRRALAWACALVLGGLGCASLPLGTETPEWVETEGGSERSAGGRYLTGFAQIRGEDEDLEAVKQRAVADLAQQISLEIEWDLVDVVEGTADATRSESRSEIRAHSDLQLDGVRFETHRRGNEVYALARLERLPAAQARRHERTRALARTEACLKGAEEQAERGEAQLALAEYRACRVSLEQAIEHDAVASALYRGAPSDAAASERIARYAAQIRGRLRSLPHEDARSVRGAAEALAEQLVRSGLVRFGTLQVAPFRYGDWDVSSPFGRELALSLQSAIARADSIERVAPDPAAGDSESVVIRGRYREGPESYALRAVASAAGTGSLLASAEIGLVREGVPEGLATRPANFESFVENAGKLGGGDVVSGDLRVELRTNKGDQGLVFDEGERLRLYVRVNRPAWVRLVYVLTNADHVPITDAWYLGDEEVNRLVEHPESFEIVPPFGVEMIHAIAYTERPGALVTRPTRVAGQDYRVVDGGADQIVRTRGIARRERRQIAEQTLHLTTMARSVPNAPDDSVRSQLLRMKAASESGPTP